MRTARTLPSCCVAIVIMALTRGVWAAPSLPELVTFEGNVALPDGVYYAVVELSETAKADAVTAAMVSAQVQRFLHSAGYEIARIAVTFDDKIRVRIDEGRLGRIVFKGVGSFDSLAVKAALNLPHKVFNQPHLVEQLEYLAEQIGLADAEYELVSVERGDSRVDLDNAGKAQAMLETVFDTHDAAQYDLHVKLVAGRKMIHRQLGVGANKEDGLVVKTGLSWTDWVSEHDKWGVYADVGAATFERFDSEGTYRMLSLLRAGAQYWGPGLGWNLRPLIWLSTDRQSRQREDLGIERYRWEQWRGSFNLEKKARHGLYFVLGAGWQYRRLREVKHLEQPSSDFRHEDHGLFVAGEIRQMLAKEGLRLDRNHFVFLQGRYLLPNELGDSWRLRWRHERWFAFGWDDLMLAVSGSMFGGDTIFPQDDPVGGRYLRGVFGRVFYVHKVAAGSAQYLFSLTEDLVKLGIFTDVAVFAPRTRAARDLIGSEWAVGTSFGLGLHMLLGGMFNLGIDVAQGIAWGGKTLQSRGAALNLKRAF